MVHNALNIIPGDQLEGQFVAISSSWPKKLIFKMIERLQVRLCLNASLRSKTDCIEMLVGWLASEVLSTLP
jgi:hypothetical protein